MNNFYLTQDGCSSEVAKLNEIFRKDDDVPDVVTVHQIGDEGLSQVSDGSLSHRPHILPLFLLDPPSGKLKLDLLLPDLDCGL